MKQHERVARRVTIKEKVEARIVRPPGTDCWVWVGDFSLSLADPVVTHDGKAIHVKSWLRQMHGYPTPTPSYETYRTNCGHGLPGVTRGMGKRCVNPDHQVPHRVYTRAQVQAFIAAAKEKRRRAA